MSSTMNFFTKKTKNSSFESEGTPNNEADDKSNCDGEQARSHFKKANSYPIAVMLFMAICLNIQIQPSESKDLKCSSKQIAWKNKTTNRIDSCMNCPECPPSQQYSIPCGMEVYIGTEVKCVDCPSGMYSENFDTKPCVSCNICTNKKVTQNCTKSQKAICKRCIKGHFYDRHTFSCMPFATQATVKVTVPTTPPINKSTIPPTIRLPTTTNSPTTWLPTTTTTNSPTTRLPTTTNSPTTTLPPRENTTGAKAIISAGSSGSSATTHGGTGQANGLWIAVVVCLSVVVVILTIAIIVYKHHPDWRPWKGKYSCRRSCRDPKDEEANIAMVPIAREGKGQSTKVNEYFEDSDRHFTPAFKSIHDGMDSPSFERDFNGVVCPLGVKRSEVHYIKNNGQGAFECLLEYLKSHDPSKTMEDIAEAFEKQGQKDLAEQMRSEDERMKSKKASSPEHRETMTNQG